MTDETFREPADTDEDWVDVRMTDPTASEWEVDIVVVEGEVEYVDLRVRPDILGDFVACLVEDVGTDRAARVLATAADRRGVGIEAGDRPVDDGGDEATAETDVEREDDASESERAAESERRDGSA